MAHVVSENCIRCKYTDCVAACPVDCFHEGPNILVIDPVECIDCRACVAACPAEAIFFEEDLPADQAEFIALNRDLSAVWPVIKAQQSPMDGADEWKGRTGKRALLER